MDIQDERRRNTLEVNELLIYGMAKTIEDERSDYHSDDQRSPSTDYQVIRRVDTGRKGNH